MNPNARAATLCCLVSALHASAVLGQDTAAVRFHRGQWGADFSVTGGFYGTGLVKFRSPTRAWVLDVFGGFRSVQDSAQFAYHEGATQQVWLEFGSRNYRPLGSRVYRTLTFGVLGSYDHRSDSVSMGATAHTTNWGAGLFADLGAEWMVTPHMSLGATWEVRAQYSHEHSTQSGNALDSDSFELTFDGIGLRGALYF